MIAKLKRSLWVGIGAMLVLGVGVFLTQATHADRDETPKKVFVCKYVGTPHVDERLQTGQNPISVSIHSIQHNEWDGQVPGWFSDAHDRSYVLAYDIGQPEPSVSSCPAPETPHDATASVLVSKATCEAPAQLTYGPATFATYSGTANHAVGPQPYNVTATADAGHLFSVNSMSTLSFSGTLDAQKASQSNDPKADCFNPPVLEPTVTYSEWVDGTILCGETTVDQTRTKTVVSHTWTKVDGEWVIVDGTPVVTTEHQSRTLSEGEIKQCPAEGTATAEVKVVKATCKPDTLVYVNVDHAQATEGSTADGTTGPKQYTVTFKADEGYVFDVDSDNNTTVTYTGTLMDPSKDPSCEQGDVLGDTTNTPTPTVTTLPETSGEATTVITVGGSLLLVVAGLAGARRFLTRGL